MHAVVKELLTRDFVVLNGIDTNFFEGRALIGGLVRDVQGEEDDELVRVCAIEKRASHSLPIEVLVRDLVFRFLNHGTLAGGLLAVVFH